MANVESPNPRPTGILIWAARTAWSARVPLVLAVMVSLGLHSGMPLIWNADIRQTEAVGIMEIISAPPPDIPMPESDQNIDALPDDDIGEPEKGDPDEPAGDPDPAPADPAPADPAPVEEPSGDPPPLPTPRPPSDRPNAVKTLPSETIESLADRIARRKRERADALRRAREGRGGQGGTGDKPGGGSTTPRRTKKGKPGAVYVCHKDGLGEELVVRSERPVGEWVTIIPTVLMPFKTRPSLGSYIQRMRQVVWRHRKKVKPMGPVEFALPSDTLQMPLDQPAGVRAVLGRSEGRCLIGMRYTKYLFPIELRHVPMRLLDARNQTVDAVVDIKFFKDGGFAVTSRDGTKLPFRRGKLKNSKGIKRTIDDHYNAARTLKEIAGWFGVDVKKVARDARKNAAKKRQQDQKRTARKP